MDLVPPPFADDVEEDFGPYSRDEIIVARASLLHTMQRENSMAWRNIKYKLGILPNGHRLRAFDPSHVWLPPELPEIWSAPVALHDPTASSSFSQSTKDSDKGTKTDEYEKYKRSESLGTRKESSHSPNNDIVRSSSSGRLSGKRKWEENLHGDDFSEETFDDGLTGKASAKSVKKSKKATANRNTSLASTSMDGDVRSSNQVRGGSSVFELNDDDLYEVVYQCDLCNYSCQVERDMRQHLNHKSHYAASRYLAVREGHSGELRLAFLSVASLIKESQHMFKEKVAACPFCHSIFPSLAQCLSHTLENHQQLGQYSFRDIIQTGFFDFRENTCICTDCGEEFCNEDLASHVKRTEHMSSYGGQKTSQPMMIFLCPFCPISFYNNVSYKSHVFCKHAKQVGSSKMVTGPWCMVGQSRPAQTTPPKDPGVSLDKINYDFSSPPIPGDPGFRGAVTKSKMKRWKHSLISQKERMGRKRKKNATHKERLAAFKRMKEKRKVK